MEQQSLMQLVKRGLSAMKAGSNVAAKATGEITNDATNPALVEKLNEGNDQSKQWAARIDRALEEAGAEADMNNEILEAHYRVSKEIRATAEDETSRDLGIIASGQMALHYWIASFGTMRVYAEQLGLTETMQAMEDSLEEAKAADLGMTEVAMQIMGIPAQPRAENVSQVQLQ